MPDKEGTDVPNNKIPKMCDCRPKYEKLLQELHTRLEEEHKADKAKALKEFSEKVSDMIEF